MKIKISIKDTVLFLIISSSIIYLAFDPKTASAAASEGLKLCINTIIPSLFPFLVLSSVFIKIGGANILGKALGPVMRPLFGVSGNGAAALILGLIGGYPLGAKTAGTLYENGLCSKKEAEKLLGFCGNCGLGFIFGIIGSSVFGNSKAGLIIYLIHILSSILTGIVLRGHSAKKIKTNLEIDEIKPTFPEIFTQSVKASFSSALDVCGFVIFFNVVNSLFSRIGLSVLISGLLTDIGLESAVSEIVFSGLLELTSGVNALKNVANTNTALLLASVLVSWGGISVHCQTVSVLSGSGLSTKKYFLGKAIQTAFSAIISFAAIKLLPETVSVFSMGDAGNNIYWPITIILLAAIFMLLLISFFICPKAGKKCGKERKKVV